MQKIMTCQMIGFVQYCTEIKQSEPSEQTTWMVKVCTMHTLVPPVRIYQSASEKYTSI